MIRHDSNLAVARQVAGTAGRGERDQGRCFVLSNDDTLGPFVIGRVKFRTKLRLKKKKKEKKKVGGGGEGGGGIKTAVLFCAPPPFETCRTAHHSSVNLKMPSWKNCTVLPAVSPEDLLY